MFRRVWEHVSNGLLITACVVAAMFIVVLMGFYVLLSSFCHWVLGTDRKEKGYRFYA